MATVLELRTEGLKFVTEGRKITDKASAEKRSLTAEERTNFDKYMSDYDAKKTEWETIEADDKRSKAVAAATAEMEKTSGRRTEAPNPAAPGGAAVPGAAVDETRGLVKFPGRNVRGMVHQSTNSIRLDIEKPMQTPEGVKAFRDFLKDGRDGELRNLQSDIDTQGGFLVVPQQFVAKLIQIVDDQVFIRSMATIITLVNAASLGIPTRDVDIADSDWTSELATGNEDTVLAFGKRELQPHPLAKRIRVSNKLLRAGALDVEQIVSDRLGYKFGITQEKAFMVGDGIQKPLGLFTPSSNGISTARDVVTGSATNYTADGLINAKYFLKPQYWPSATWGFHRFGVQRIRELKDANGQYLWAPSGIGQASLKDGVADTILGLPYFISEYVPSVFTTGLYTGILGDFSFYWIVEALGMTVQRLVELYAATNQTGFIARMEMDGAPVLEEPFVRVINS